MWLNFKMVIGFEGWGNKEAFPFPRHVLLHGEKSLYAITEEGKDGVSHNTPN